MEGGAPLRHILGVEDVEAEGFEFADLFFDSVGEVVDLFGAASDCFEVVAEDGEELLLHFAGFLEVFEDTFHVLGFVEDVLDTGEVPTTDRRFLLDFHLGSLETLIPLVQHLDTLLNDVE